MKPAQRRIWLPWLLLLVPTLLIGAVALRLLWLEQRRVAEVEAEAQTRAVVATRDRAQVAADNIELLVAEIRDGLMRELAETPPENLDALLANWPRTNPLVAQTFLWKPNGGGLAWPPADTTEHIAFRRRHSDLFRGGATQLVAWLQAEERVAAASQLMSGAAVQQAATQAPQKETPALQPAPAAPPGAAVTVVDHSLAAEPMRQQVASAAAGAQQEPVAEADVAFQSNEGLLDLRANAQVMQNSTLRRDVRQETKASAERARASAYRPAAKSSSSMVKGREQPEENRKYPVSGDSAKKAEPRRAEEGVAAQTAERLKAEAEQAQAARARELKAAAEEASRKVADREAEILRLRGETERMAKAADEAPAVALGAPTPVAPASAGAAPVEGAVAGADAARVPWGEPMSGWLSRTAAGSVYFLGWWQPAGGGAVRGVELNLPAVLERVQALVPEGTRDGERFALRGPGEALGDSSVRLPLQTTLPGWTLAAWPGAEARYSTSDGGGAFFVVAALLVGAFVVSILAGGVLFFRQAAAAAREAALKTSFVSNVSHEMKTPLTTIRMYAEMLADERVDDPAKRARYFATIGRETTRLTRLVNNALDFGRLEAGRKEYRPETIVLAQWLARLAEVHAPRLAEAGLRLAVAELPVGAAVRCDADSLDQMALNLVDNAVKYAAGGGVLDLAVERSGPGWSLIVADRGPGVPAAHRERIFERFHRVDDSLTATKQGAGLGLTIARRLARDQGGDLVCHEREGGGAAFVLTLPAATA